MYSEPKSNNVFGVDHISMNDCQLLETKYTLLHLRVLIIQQIVSLRWEEKNIKKGHSGLTVEAHL